MSFRGALLKPSERNGAGRSNKPSRGISQRSRYEVLKEKIRTWWHDRLKIGEHLKEIRDEKLYKHEHSNFEDFCVAEFDLKHSQAYALIAAVDVKASLKPSAMAEEITNERQARALVPVPAEQRAEVLEKVIERGPVTAKAITEAAREIATPIAIKETGRDKETKTEHRDKTGYVIPDSILEDWQRAEQFGSVLREISKVKSILKKGLEDSDLIFAEVNNTTVSTLTNAYGDLKRVLPYAVCSTCQGRTPKKCTTCRGRGFVSEFYYSTCVPEETKKIREKAIKK
jgi:hypothetical protein